MFLVLFYFIFFTAFVFYDSSLVSSICSKKPFVLNVSIQNETTTNSIYYVVFVFICLVFSIISSVLFFFLLTRINRFFIFIILTSYTRSFSVIHPKRPFFSFRFSLLGATVEFSSQTKR